MMTRKLRAYPSNWVVQSLEANSEGFVDIQLKRQGIHVADLYSCYGYFQLEMARNAWNGEHLRDAVVDAGFDVTSQDECYKWHYLTFRAPLPVI